MLLLVSPVQAEDTFQDTLQAARTNFGRVLQDPLANFRGVIAENGFYGNTGIDNDVAMFSKIQGLYAMPMPERGLNFIPRVIVPVMGLPPLSDFPFIDPSGGYDKTKWGMSDIILQGFIGPATEGSFKWGVGPQFSLKTHTDEIFEGAGWGGGASAVGVYSSGQWGLTGIIGHMTGFEKDFNLSLFRPFISYNVKSIPGFAITTSPQITYDWNPSSGNGWSVPLGGGVTQAIPFSKTMALLVGLGGYHFVSGPDLGPEYQINLTFALMFARDVTK